MSLLTVGRLVVSIYAPTAGSRSNGGLAASANSLRLCANPLYARGQPLLRANRARFFSDKRVDSGPTRPAELPCRACVHPAERDNRHLRTRCEQSEPQRAEHLSAGVRAGRKDGGEQQRRRLCRAADFTHRMDRHQMPARPVGQICTPAPRHCAASGQTDHMAVRSRNPRQHYKPRPAFGWRQVVVTEDEPAPARQAPQRTFERSIVTRVRNQPHCREGLQSRHVPAIAARND